MPKYSNTDHYLDRSAGVLRNRLGITSSEKLEKAEATFASIRSYELVKDPLQGQFDFKHLKAIHHHMFKDLYEWAGQARDIDIAKGDNFFAHHAHIETAAKSIFTQLAQEKHLSGLSKEGFCDRAAFYLGEINALHPFREGNGRTQREFISHLAYKNGLFIEWQNISQDEMVAASIASFRDGDCSGLAALMRVNIRDLPGNMGQAAFDVARNPYSPKL